MPGVFYYLRTAKNFWMSVVLMHNSRNLLWQAKCSNIQSFNFLCNFFFYYQVFIDPTFFGIFVFGPLQSFVVNVCTLCILGMVLSMFYRLVLANFIFSARHQLDTWTLAPRKTLGMA